MGKRQNYLKNLISKRWEVVANPKPTNNDILTSKYSEYVFEVYSKLRGQFDVPPTNIGKWDISTKHFIIELDEECHFNRYRHDTLGSLFYMAHDGFILNKYKDYCIEKEVACLKTAARGGYWKNNSTERQFCKSDINGILDNNGSSRWRQRAFYDFLKDISGKVMDVPVLRISIYDTYKNFTVNQLMKSGKEQLLYELISLKVESNDNEVLPPHVIVGILRGQEDFKAGRTTTLEEFKRKLLSSK